MKQRPRLSWPADPDKLYTVMFFDHGKLSAELTQTLPISIWLARIMSPTPDSSRTIRIVDGAPQILSSEAERTPPQERPQQFHFWVVTNIPGSDVARGNEIIAYDSPLALEFDGSRINKDYPPHHSPLLVFEQLGGRVGRIFETFMPSGNGNLVKPCKVMERKSYLE